jgi:hypothetical protein
VRRPPSSSTAAANAGNASISHAACCTPVAGIVVNTACAAFA